MNFAGQLGVGHQDQAADAVVAATQKFSPCLEALIHYVAGMLLGSNKLQIVKGHQRTRVLPSETGVLDGARCVHLYLQCWFLI